MSWTGNDDAAVTTRIATVLNSLQPSERRVVDHIMGDLDGVVEMTAQDLADRTGVARSTVIRTCQTLGYRGFPQLRVALTRELAQSGHQTEDFGESALGTIRAEIAALAASLPQIASVLSEADVEAAVVTLLSATRLLALANGLSSPLASDLSMRLTAIGRPTEFVADPIGQQIAARQLSPTDAAIILSGSGANESSLKAARAVKLTGARLVVITSLRHFSARIAGGCRPRGRSRERVLPPRARAHLAGAARDPARVPRGGHRDPPRRSRPL